MLLRNYNKGAETDEGQPNLMEEKDAVEEDDPVENK